MKDNVMRKIRVEKVTLNIGSGSNPDRLAKAVKLIEQISERKAVQTKASKRIPQWDLRPGLAIGTKVTIRGKAAVDLLKRLLEAVDFKLKKSSFVENGFSFGIKEYIDIPEMKYDPQIGMMGLDVCVTLGRPGFRIKRRKIAKKEVPTKHRVNAEEAVEFAINEFGVKMND